MRLKLETSPRFILCDKLGALATTAAPVLWVRPSNLFGFVPRRFVDCNVLRLRMRGIILYCCRVKDVFGVEGDNVGVL